MSASVPGQPNSVSDALTSDAGAGGLGDYQMLLLAAERLLDDVDRALASLDDGSYGRCEFCGTRVDDRELEEDPLANRCAPHRGQAGD